MSSSQIAVVGTEEMETEVADVGETENVENDNGDAGVNLIDNVEDNGDEGMDVEDEFLNSDNVFFSPQDRDMKPIPKRPRGRPPGVNSYGNDDSNYKIIPVACEICGKILPSSSLLDEHMSTHSVNIENHYQCPRCPKRFPKFSILQAHVRAHGVKRMFECPICRQQFSRHDCVKIHMRIHDKDKCINCEVCHKSFLTNGALNIHMRIHRGEKPFKCHFCGKCFTQKSHVITHIKRHANISDTPVAKPLGPRLFKCTICFRSFIRVSDFERHMQWNHSSVGHDVVNQASSYISNEQESRPSNYIMDEIKKKSGRRIMRTTSTQTDIVGEHVIIPTKYKEANNKPENIGSATPNVNRAEEMYDLFDEGMDRNFSSDEESEKEEGNERSSRNNKISTSSKSAAERDKAFDAIIGIGEKEQDESKSTETKDETVSVIDDVKIVADDANWYREQTQKIVEERIKNQLLKASEIPKSTSETDAEVKKSTTVDIKVIKAISAAMSNAASSKEPNSTKDSKLADKANLKQDLKNSSIMFHFNTVNWKCVGKPRRQKPAKATKFKPKDIIGLSAPTHLSLIRRSLKSIAKESHQPNKNKDAEDQNKKNADHSDDIAKTLTLTNESVAEPDKSVQAENSRPLQEKRTRRQTKNKQHDKDFVCNAKSCEICNENKLQDKESVNSEVVEKTEESTPDTVNSSEITTETNNLPVSESIDVPSPTTVDEKTQNDAENSKARDHSQKLLQFLLSGEGSDLEGTDFKLLNEVQKIKHINTARKYEAKSYEETTVPYYLPTFSCKLCGKEFRFEGKLHRHIEAVHQNKPLFTDDVKPGKGCIIRRDEDELFSLVSSYSVVERNEEFIDIKPKPPKTEIETLRSEWDDEDDNQTDENKMDISEEPTSNFIKVTRTLVPELLHKRNVEKCNYLSTVKVNIAKATDNEKQEEALPLRKEYATELEYYSDKLLRKLFDLDLLKKCGLRKEHISVVLGKLLRHYGVKMIEDYGQGQYEVLKYNLWRLIEWKVTMEQMEEFYSAGKSVEKMMDDIIEGRVPVLNHDIVAETVDKEEKSKPAPSNANGQQSSEVVEVPANQLMLSQMNSVLSEQINLSEGITQVVLAKDMSPEMLRGAQIVTIDPNTGQIISQVSADQFIITADALPEQNQAVQSKSANETSSLPPGSIIATNMIQNLPVIVSTGQNLPTASTSEGAAKTTDSTAK